MKKTIRRILFILCILIMISGILYLIKGCSDNKEKHEVYEELQNEEPEEEVPEVEIEIPEPEEKEPVILPEKFEAAMEKYEDVYAWITIENTNVDYPVVQHPYDDGYYLDYTIDGYKGYPGSIYTEHINPKDFSDFVTVIYGHNMKNGSMFNHLHKFSNADFFEKNKTFTIYLEDEIKTYDIYAAITYDDRHLMYAFNYETTEGRQEFIESIQDSYFMSDQYREGITVDENSHFVVLSTCMGNAPSNRFLLIGVEVVEE